ncbi:hypothetical protein SBF1_1950008 [Candidatus Desulfosporosinus infrequens]|uniref:Uncharacterized protein n=1 Tax=Candidatus Desulfosporosinus infrequens TaxID=2043169 RepID=A0A2U3KGI3_9FIRM|nr:hypothetical protein SBF1_1950008 [Candidatus Desulfosporosinus infrequens]
MNMNREIVITSWLFFAFWARFCTNQTQIDFLKKVIDYITQNGYIHNIRKLVNWAK